MPLGEHVPRRGLPETERADAGVAEAGSTGSVGHVLLVWNPSGYSLLARAGEPPRVGSEVGVSGGRRVVTKIGASPLPGDRRRCVFLDAP